jgi:hypothetical protein
MIHIDYTAGAATAVVEGRMIDLAISYRAERSVDRQYEVALMRGVINPKQMMKLLHYLQAH